MNLLEKLSSFFKQTDKTTAFEALKTFVTPLADIDADYPDRVLAYIFSGEGADKSHSAAHREAEGSKLAAASCVLF